MELGHQSQGWRVLPCPVPTGTPGLQEGLFERCRWCTGWRTYPDSWLPSSPSPLNPGSAEGAGRTDGESEERAHTPRNTAYRSCGCKEASCHSWGTAGCHVLASLLYHASRWIAACAITSQRAEKSSASPVPPGQWGDLRAESRPCWGVLFC